MHDRRVARGRGEKETQAQGVGMEQITRRDGVYYFGDRRCIDVEDAYRRFRDEYHESLGRAVYKRLDRIGQRKERIHGFGFDFDCGYGNLSDRYGRTRYRLLGLVDISYCRLVGMWDYPALSDNEFDGWLDWAFSRNSGGLTMVGRRQKVGRTGKKFGTRYVKL